MKHFFFLLSAIAAFSFATAQNPIPNSDFSTYWPSSPGQPGGFTDCQDITQISPGNGITGWAAQGYKSAGTYPAFITSSAGAGIAISTAYTNFSLYYRFTSVNGDKMKVSVSIFNASHVQIGSGYDEVTASTSAVNFTAMNIPIYYTGTGAAEVIISVLMNTSAGGPIPNVGSNFAIDDLLLTSGSVGISDTQKESSAFRIYPNPATAFTFVELKNISEKINSVQLLDMNGRIVKEISGAGFSSNAITLPLTDLPCGTYTVAVRNDKSVQTKRLVIE